MRLTAVVFSIMFIGMSISDGLTKKSSHETATLAGGCFWCMEKPFDTQKGVLSTISGYAGGNEKNPTYKDVGSGKTGHREAIQVTFDPKVISYEKILDIFWRQFDPTDNEGQFADRGKQYKSGIFYHSDKQKEIAITSKRKLEASKVFSKPIITEILPFTAFYKAEDYHQDYYKKNPLRYKYYRNGSGRDKFLEKTWKEENMSDLKSRLTPLQYKVTQENGTEEAFKNTYWNNKKEGLYVDIVSGEPIFSSKDKFDSGTGWPAFSKPLDDSGLVLKKDFSHFMIRTEVRSKSGKSHLGHVFKKVKKSPTGDHFCINSAAMRFIAVEDLKKEGYESYLKLFK